MTILSRFHRHSAMLDLSLLSWVKWTPYCCYFRQRPPNLIHRLLSSHASFYLPRNHFLRLVNFHYQSKRWNHQIRKDLIGYLLHPLQIKFGFKLYFVALDRNLNLRSRWSLERPSCLTSCFYDQILILSSSSNVGQSSFYWGFWELLIKIFT